MIFIAVKFTIRPDIADQWLTRVASFTAVTRAESGNLFFEWSRSVERPISLCCLKPSETVQPVRPMSIPPTLKWPWHGCLTPSRPRRRLSTLKHLGTAGRLWPKCDRVPPSTTYCTHVTPRIQVTD
jgi:hypothetical protein